MLCSQCGLEKPDNEVKLGTCDHCYKFGPPRNAMETGPSAHELELRGRMRKMILTTSVDVPNRKIDKVLTIVATEVALGMNIVFDLANNWHDILVRPSNHVATGSPGCTGSLPR